MEQKHRQIGSVSPIMNPVKDATAGVGVCASPRYRCAVCGVFWLPKKLHSINGTKLWICDSCTLDGQ